jgi:hypothetical protein
MLDATSSKRRAVELPFVELLCEDPGGELEDFHIGGV